MDSNLTDNSPMASNPTVNNLMVNHLMANHLRTPTVSNPTASNHTANLLQILTASSLTTLTEVTNSLLLQTQIT